ncbi:quinone-dependent dihydroorotate dehydrogenase [Sulfobacillus acidophilus]|uniref:Dihydroorotate dehydrogenase (quinone) n=1 Tax=Sulfobacillus acidophilus TaxID=53633 RepID=A0ABS3AVQ6_9FIRM|nr:quinone-dependent dihydroorotate dehydrogenase [Sulfobacillus acidophilus]
MIWPILKKILFQMDAEKAHNLVMSMLKAGTFLYPKNLNAASFCTKNLEQELFGLSFKNPIGLAAGFDKNAECLAAWQALGFGFIEVGTVTAIAQPGNPKPRIFRLPKDQALMNRLGFNNVGAKNVAQNIERQKGKIKIPLGINIGKSKVVDIKDAANDYLKSFETLSDLADYLVINVSSPNTPNLRDLQSKNELKKLLNVICNANEKKQNKKPLFLKLAPDLSLEQANTCAKTAIKFGLNGLVLTNTTINKTGLIGPVPNGSGGISGAPVFEKSTFLLKNLAQEFGNKILFIGVGGITSPKRAQEKINAGAKLIQIYTGFIYQGPLFVPKLLKNLSLK